MHNRKSAEKTDENTYLDSADVKWRGISFQTQINGSRHWEVATNGEAQSPTVDKRVQRVWRWVRIEPGISYSRVHRSNHCDLTIHSQSHNVYLLTNWD